MPTIANEKLDELQAQAENIAIQAAEKGVAVADHVADTYARGLNAVEDYTKEQPLMALAAAAVIGFTIGTLWKIR